MSDLNSFRLFVLGIVLATIVIGWLIWLPYSIARRRQVSFIPLYYVAALTIGTPLIGWIVAMVYVTTATPVTSRGMQPSP